MTDVLTRIVARKRAEVATRSSPMAQPTRRSLRAVLAKPGARFVMEVKRRSPSGHVARHSLERAVAAYAPVADAISVLTDGADFGGSLDDVRAVRDRFGGPILAKDFIVDPLQVAEARAAGADAVLVMMSVLGDAAAAAVMAAARDLAMDQLVEVHDEEELGRAIALGSTLVGINNRDLTTLGIDLATTERIAPRVPAGVVVVAESGIGSRADVLRLAPHVDAFLVGSALMAADNIGLAGRSLIFGPVKICGLTRIADVALAAAAGATHAGFIFHPASMRRLDVDQARLLVTVARNAGLRCVGVFEGGQPDIAAIARDLGLDAVQVHGRAGAALKHELGAIELVGVRAVRDGKIEPAQAASDRTLFDHRGGGSGDPFDWGLVSQEPSLGEAFLAGGIGPGNAAAAARVGAFGLDLSSGVEAAPGIKDEARMRALFAALRPASRSEA